MADNKFSVLDRNIKMCYSMGMIERDPISEWQSAIKKRIENAIGTLMLLAFVCLLVAPLFGPIIKHMKRKQYVMYSDYEERAESDMKGIRPILWTIAIVGWIVLFYCNATY
jgi:hypothetical protein